MRVKLCPRFYLSESVCPTRVSLISIKLKLHHRHLKHASTLGKENPLRHRPLLENPRKEDPSTAFLQNVNCLSEILAVPSWSFEIERALQSLSFRIAIPHVIHILRTQLNPRVLFCFFFWLRRLQGYKHNNLTYNSVVHIVVRTREFRFFEQIYFCLQEDRCLLGSITCNALIQAYGAAHKVEEAFNVFSRMNGQVLSKPNILTCNLLLHILIKENELDWADEFYHRILNDGFVPDIFTCNIWMLYLCRSQKLKEAYLWLDEMPYPPNFVSYSTLIDGLCKASKMVEASSLFDRMVDSDMSPDVFVFSSLIDGYCKAGNLHKALRYFKLMDAKGVKANIVTYTSLLDGMFKAGKADSAHEILDCMQSTGCGPNTYLCTVRIDALCKQQKLDAASNMLKHMNEVGCVPSTVTYCALIDGFLKAGCIVEALKLMAEMSSSGCSPNAFLYASLVYGFGKACEDAKAELILEESLARSSHPDTRIMNCWMSGLCRANRLEDAYHLFVNLRAEGFSPNTITYNILITGFSKVREVGCARMLFEGIQQNNCLPDLSSYTNLVKGYCKIGAATHASKCLVEASNRGFVHNFRFHVYTIINIFKMRRLYYAKSFLKLLSHHCTFTSKIDKKLFFKLLKSRDAIAAANAVARWKTMRRSKQ
ncbi:hypothetical protein L7F22_062947 [Adiantum nelumboides]|nr:hypothetical protein [Adiantum nelumboides]